MKAIRLLAAVILCPSILTAAIWRVDNDPGRAADFTSLQSAVDDAGVMDGDTIYVAGTGIGYGSVTITKQLFIYGPGYFLTQNLGETAVVTPATFSIITVGDGTGAGAGTLISGLSTTDLNVFDSNATIKRNRIFRQLAIGSVGSAVTQIKIVQNFISGATSFGNQGVIHSFNSSNSDIVIMNNYIANSTSPADAINLSGNNTATVMYNYIADGDTHLVGSVFHLNIIAAAEAITASNSSLMYNVATGAQAALSDESNKTNIAIETIIVNSGTTDGRLALAVESEAAGIGPSGEDAGIYGGDEPYVLSGVPALPTITEIGAPQFASPASGITVTIKAKARN